MYLRRRLRFLVAVCGLLAFPLVAQPNDTEYFEIRWVARPEPTITIDEIEKDSKRLFKFATHRPSFAVILDEYVKGDEVNCAIIGGGCQKNISLEPGTLLLATKTPYLIACSIDPVTEYYGNFISKFEYMCLEDKDNNHRFESIILTDQMSRSRGLSFSSKIHSKKHHIGDKNYSDVDVSTLPQLTSYINFKKYKRGNKVHKVEWSLMDGDKQIIGMVAYRGRLHVTDENLRTKGSDSFFDLMRELAIDNPSLFF